MTGGLTINLGATYGIDSKGAAAGGIFRNNSNANNVKLGAPGTTLDVSGSAAGNPSAKITEGNLNSNGLEIALPSGSTADGLVIGTNTGYEPNRGVTSYANSVGGHFEGATYGVEARARSAGVGTAVRGYNGDVGGNFTGGTTGVSGSGGTYGVLGSGTYGGVFTGSAGGTVYAGIGASAIYAFTGSPTDYGLYTTGQVYTTANATVGGQLNVNGDMDVPGNQWGAPSSPTFDAKYGSIWPNLGSVITWSTRGNRCGQYSGTVGFGRFFVCPDGTYMAGFHTDGAGRTDNAVCCEL